MKHMILYIYLLALKPHTAIYHIFRLMWKQMWWSIMHCTRIFCWSQWDTHMARRRMVFGFSPTQVYVFDGYGKAVWVSAVCIEMFCKDRASFGSRPGNWDCLSVFLEWECFSWHIFIIPLFSLWFMCFSCGLSSIIIRNLSLNIALFPPPLLFLFWIQSYVTKYNVNSVFWLAERVVCVSF